MRRIVLWLLTTVTVVVLLFGYHTSTAGPLRAESSTVAPVATGDGSGSGSGSTTVDGEVAQTEWGPVQVRLVIEGDTIADVTVLQYPDSNPKDVQINQYALPILVQETVDSQGAQVDMVSGATVTSVGYLQSLQSALDEAGL